MKFCSYAFLILLMFTAPAFATVVVSSPSNGETVGSPVQFVATGTTNCWRGVASMGVYVNNDLKQVQNGSSLNTTVSLSPGTYNTVVEEWDYCGGATYTPRTITVADQAGVFVTSPTPNSTVSSPVNYVATATTSSCSRGVASMGIYVNNQLVRVIPGAKMNTQMSLGGGAQHTVVQEWDYCGGSKYQTVNLNVAGGASDPTGGGGGGGGGNVLSNLQATGGWKSYGEYPPNYNICPSSCSGISWSMQQHVNSPSLSGNATRFNLGGSHPYADVLWTNALIGQGTTQNLPDSNHKLLPTIHNFTYDSNVFVTNLWVTQVLEFDISMYMNGAGMIWGTQCNNLGGKEWDIWDNQAAQWVSTGIACNLNNNAWNHVTLQMQRESDNTLLYQSITVNGVTYNLNKYYAPFSVPGSWWGLTVNYQMDGNYRQAWNTTYVDNFSLRYW
ncbi:MAG: hypothetical protein ACYDC6_03970 [Acidobacteriaceae bacterium]